MDGLAEDKLGRLELSRAGLQRNERVFALAESLGIPCCVFMGGGYSEPIDATVDAFSDLFLQAAAALGAVSAPQSGADRSRPPPGRGR